MSRGGLPLRTALDKLKSRFNDFEVQTLASAINDGMPVTDAFDKAGFSEFEVNLVHAGERSGRLEDIFSQLAQFWRNEDTLVGGLWRQSLYPLVVLHVAAFFYPLPGALERFNASPANAAFVYMLSLAFVLFMMYATGFGVYMIIGWLWRTPPGQKILLAVPLLGPAWKATYAYRWIIALRLEYAAGLPLSDAVYDAWQATGFAERDEPAEQGKQHILSGEPLSTVYPRWKQYLPIDWQDYIETGEISGKLSDTFVALEEQALHSWKLAMAAVNEWMPRFFLVGILILAVGLFFSAFAPLFYKVYNIFQGVQLG